MITVFHNGKSIHLRHDNIKNNNIRLSFFYDITDFFSVMCLTYQRKILILFNHTTQYFYHFFIIICNCYI